MLFYGLLIKVARIFENHTNVRECKFVHILDGKLILIKSL